MYPATRAILWRGFLRFAGVRAFCATVSVKLMGIRYKRKRVILKQKGSAAAAQAAAAFLDAGVYFAIVFINRMRIAASCARVALSLGSSSVFSPSVLPCTSPAALAQDMAVLT